MPAKKRLPSPARPALAIHAHCYQPDRSQPETGRLPLDPGAAPYRDFNAKITAECYRPNAELGNFERLSFDIGPTLAAWLERSEPATWGKIQRAARRYAADHGAGNALAQSFHHTILPLASRRDQQLQVAWGIADFEHRFGRRPRGLWLPETAADLETLAVLAEQGIEFTILAPWQAADAEALDVTVPYWVELPGGGRIAVFFFHAELSATLSFNPDATRDADRFAARLKRATTASRRPRLLTLATDGELYGHHQKFRDLFLAQLLDSSAPAAGFEVSTPERFLAAHPPTTAVELSTPSSWSCHHGVDRWRRACPCTPDAAWKAPLRAALDQLAERLDAAYLSFAEPYVEDPWRLRQRWIEVLLQQRPAAEVIAAEASRPLSEEIRRALERLLAAQVQRQRMFTSCGRFFSDPEGREPGYVLTAAAAAIRWTRAVTGEDAEPETMERLSDEAAAPLARRLAAALESAEVAIRP